MERITEHNTEVESMNTVQTIMMAEAIRKNERQATLAEVLEAAMLADSTEEIISVIFKKMMEISK